MKILRGMALLLLLSGTGLLVAGGDLKEQLDRLNEKMTRDWQDEAENLRIQLVQLKADINNSKAQGNYQELENLRGVASMFKQDFDDLNQRKDIMQNPYFWKTAASPMYEDICVELREIASALK